MEKKQVAILAVICGITIFGIKLLAYSISNSVASLFEVQLNSALPSELETALNAEGVGQVTRLIDMSKVRQGFHE